MASVIRSSKLEVSIKEVGAELCSIKDADGIEYIWQADPAVWGKHAPILFPIVGRLVDDNYQYNGETYSMPKHGFARGMAFEQTSQEDDSVCFTLSSNAETAQMYPFEFELNIRYKVLDSKLTVSYEVINKGDAVMPFSIGGHPGFSLSFEKDERLTDYYLKFERTETVCTRRLDGDGYLMGEPELMLSGRSTIKLASHTFDDDALMFFDLKSKTVRLKSRKQQRYVLFDYTGFPQLGIWAKPGAPFVCIEPWFGYNDAASGGGDIMKKPGIVTIDPGAAFTCSHSIAIMP